jgi:hypothetical protein
VSKVIGGVQRALQGDDQIFTLTPLRRSQFRVMGITRLPLRGSVRIWGSERRSLLNAESQTAGGVEAVISASEAPRSAATTVNRQFTLVTTLAAYCMVVLVGVTHHEPWADEAQAWLLSRDLGYRYLVFHQLAYEGVPPL